jgi:hypothetical protein
LAVHSRTELVYRLPPGQYRRLRALAGLDDRIFQKFAQAASSDRGGSGLGLSITKAIVEHMSGHVGFESEPGRTTFYFDLPEWKRPVSRVKASENTWLSER